MKRLLFSFLSSFALIVLSTLLVHQPASVSAQGYTPSAPVCGTNPEGTFGEPVPYCGSLGAVADTVPFVLPTSCKDNSGNPIECKINAAVYVQGMQGQTAENRLYKEGNYIIQTSNEKHLAYRIQGDGIMFVQDTTWANAEQCTDAPNKAFQRIYSNDARTSLGAKLLDRAMSCGAITKSNAFNKAYKYEQSMEEALRANPAGSANACTSAHEGNVTGSRQLIFHGRAKCGEFDGEMMSIYNNDGPGKGEVFMYCKDRGLCGWYQNINFGPPDSENQPNHWEGKDICSGFGLQTKACPVQCSEKEINQVVQLPIGQAFVAQAHIALNTGINVSVLQPAEDTFQIHDVDQAWLKPVNRGLLSNEYDMTEGEVAPGKKGVIRNIVPYDVTTRSMLQTGAGPDVTITNTDGGNIYSKDKLSNSLDYKAFRERYNDSMIGGSIFGSKVLRPNTNKGIDLTTPSEKIEDLIFVPCNNKTGVDPKKIIYAPDGINNYAAGANSSVVTIGIQVAADIVTELIRFITGGDKQKEADIASLLGINVRLCTCTHITNVDNTVRAYQERDNAQLPSEVRNFIETKIPVDSEFVNKVNNPIAGTGSEIPLKVSYPINQEYERGIASTCMALSKYTPVQGYEKCSEQKLFEPTSSWVRDGSTSSTTNNPAIEEAIKSAADRIGVPMCVLQGIAYIEGGYGWTPNDPRIASCPSNYAGAAGPFQFTPGAWAMYGQGASRCDIQAAADAAARKVRADGPLTNASATIQQTQILNAGYHYFGVRSPICPWCQYQRSDMHDKYGNYCSYGEFLNVYSCDPNYRCTNRGG